MDAEEFSRRYDELYAQACALFEKHNPCKIIDGNCMRGRELEYTGFCCDGCEHLSDTGCTVHCLWCKTWTCYQIDDDELLTALKAIEREAYDLHMIGYRRSKRYVMRRLYEPLDSTVPLLRYG